MKALPSEWMMLTLVARSCRAGRTRAIRWTRAPRSCPVSSRSVVPCLPPASSCRQQNPLCRQFVPPTAGEECFAWDVFRGRFRL